MDARAYVESHAREFIDDLKQWLAIPSISADPEHHNDVRRSAEWLAAHLSTIVEGEEESGSEHFAELLRQHRDRLACDVIVVSDTSMWAADVPSMCTGMRGLASAEVTLTGPVRDLHSGAFGGGVPNPLHAMAALLDGLHDDAGRVTLPRFYDRVLPLSDDCLLYTSPSPRDRQKSRMPSSA